MTLIAILVALLAERLNENLTKLRVRTCFACWVKAVRGWPAMQSRQDWADLLVLVVPVGLTAALAAWLGSFWFGVPGLLFAIVVLFLTLHPRHINPHLEAYLEARELNDDNAARREAQFLLEDAVPESVEDEVREVADAVLLGGLTQVFAVLFWFVILGPAGAMLYRLAWQLCRREDLAEDEASKPAGWRERLLAILEWLPARLMAGLFLLVGAWDKGMKAWREPRIVQPHENEDTWAQETHALLKAVGRGAINAESQVVCEVDSNECLITHAGLVISARAVVLRAIIAGIAIVALATLAGWVA